MRRKQPGSTNASACTTTIRRHATACPRAACRGWFERSRQRGSGAPFDARRRGTPPRPGSSAASAGGSRCRESPRREVRRKAALSREKSRTERVSRTWRTERVELAWRAWRASRITRAWRKSPRRRPSDQSPRRLPAPRVEPSQSSRAPRTVSSPLRRARASDHRAPHACRAAANPQPRRARAPRSRPRARTPKRPANRAPVSDQPRASVAKTANRAGVDRGSSTRANELDPARRAALVHAGATADRKRPDAAVAPPGRRPRTAARCRRRHLHRARPVGDPRHAAEPRPPVRQPRQRQRLRGGAGAATSPPRPHVAAVEALATPR